MKRSRDRPTLLIEVLYQIFLSSSSVSSDLDEFYSRFALFGEDFSDCSFSLLLFSTWALLLSILDAAVVVSMVWICSSFCINIGLISWPNVDVLRGMAQNFNSEE